jgi:phospholipid-binding lipoprotein MlaA
MQRIFSLGALLLAAIQLTGCASLPPGHERDPHDPLERYNRAVYSFNDAIDRTIGTPVAKVYVKVAPAPVRTGVGNFFENLSYTTTVASDLLQLKLKPFATDTLRLVVNTTIGIGGLFDPATQFGIPTGDEDLGQTLGRWGVPAGPYFVLPVFGPSSVRDAFGWYMDRTYTYPVQYLTNSPYVEYGLAAMDLVDQRASLLSVNNTLNKTFDPYTFTRNAYLQRREYQVKDGSAPAEEVEIFEDEAEPAK